MSVRKDTVQINVEIKADQGVREFQKLSDDSRKLTTQLTKLKKAGKENTDEYKRVEAQLKKVNSKFAELGGKGATLGQLSKRAGALNREIKNLAPGTKRFIAATDELKKVNSRMKGIRDKTKQTATGLNRMKQNAGGLPGIFGKMSAALNPLVLAAGVVALARGIFNLGKESLKFYDVQAKADAQLKSALKSTNEIAGRSFEQLSEAADELQKKTLFGDEETQRGQALLLTFTNIRDEIFDRTTPALLDMATAMKTDVQSAGLQLGKALNDPIKGISALGRAGIQFSDEQKGLIKTLVETNRTAEAQSLILDELEKQFGGSAEAAAKAGTGGLTQLQNKVNDIKEAFGLLIVSGLQRLTPFLNKAADFVGKLVDTMLSGEKATGKYGVAINAIVFAFKQATLGARILWEFIKFNWNLMGDLFDYVSARADRIRTRFNNLIEGAKRFTIIRIAIDNISKALKVFSDLVDNVPATFAGIKAAALQMANIVRNNFEKMSLAAQIFGKKAQLFVTLNEDKKKFLESQIKLLEQFQAIAATKGQSVGQAYVQARDEFIEKANANSQGLALPGSSTPTSGSTSGTSNSTTGTSTQEDEIVKEKFFEAVNTLQEQGEELFQVRKMELERRLQLLIDSGRAESLATKLTQEEITAIQKEQEAVRLANTERTEELRRKTQQMSYNAFRGVVDGMIALLGADEKARKKNAVLLKSFSIGKVIADGFAEIQSIWRTANANPSNILFPGSGSLIAGAKSVSAGLRTAAAVKKINSTSFYYGGPTGNKSLFKDNQGRDIVGGVHKNEWVAPEWMTSHPEYAPLISNLENARKRGFSEGGFATSDTNFGSNISGSIQTAGPSSNMMQNISKDIIASNQAMVIALEQKQFQVPATQVEDALNEISELQSEASF